MMKSLKISSLGFSIALLMTIVASPVSIGALSPARNLVGTWQSALSGKGFVLTGSSKSQNTYTTVKMTGDVKLVIKTVKGNLASGTITYSNMSETITVKVSIPGMPSVTRTNTMSLPGHSARISAQVSSSRITLPTINMNGATLQMWGSFTSDLMMISEKMTSTVEGLVTTLNGSYRLMRKR